MENYDAVSPGWSRTAARQQISADSVVIDMARPATPPMDISALMTDKRLVMHQEHRHCTNPHNAEAVPLMGPDSPTARESPMGMMMEDAPAIKAYRITVDSTVAQPVKKVIDRAAAQKN